jgi:hydroxypyruvate isomerase
MPKFSANLSMLFCELPFLERFAAAAQAGFKAVEYVAPYGYPPEQIAVLLEEHDLRQALFNMPAGDWEKGERGIGCHPDRIGEFQDGVGKVIDYAKTLKCPKVNCLAGILPNDVPHGAAFKTLAGNLSFAAAALRAESILLVVEPINSHDIPGFFLNTSSHGLNIMDAVASDNLKLQYDVYHMQRMEGELMATLLRLMPRIGHIQIADDPGRHEPGTGKINYARILKLIDELGYDGWVGAEYRPLNGTVAGLSWMKDYNDA